MKDTRHLTADEVFFIFKEEHRLCSPLDPEADPSFELLPTSTVDEWTNARDLLSWDKLSTVYNEEFRIEIPLESWKTAFQPGDKRTIKDVCELIAKHATIELISPLNVFGQSCLSSAIFKSIKKDLASRGIDVHSLSPSSQIEPILKNYFGEFVGYINIHFTGVIPEIRERKTLLSKLAAYSSLITILSLFGGFFWNELLIIVAITILPTIVLWYLSNRQFKKQANMLTIPGIVTFRDLIDRILELRYPSKQSISNSNGS